MAFAENHDRNYDNFNKDRNIEVVNCGCTSRKDAKNEYFEYSRGSNFDAVVKKLMRSWIKND